MEDRIKKILCNEYNFHVEKMNVVEGGYRPDETYFLLTSNQVKYIVKYIQYARSFDHLEEILKFENVLHHLYNYPCPEIILSKKDELFIDDNHRFLFVQTLIEGIEPTKEILDQDHFYLLEMGRLLARWRIVSRKYSFHLEENEQFSEKWWEEQPMENLHPFLLQNFLQCKKDLINLGDHLEIGLIHNDFHTNNSLISNDKNIFIIDFVDACRSVFLSDLATSLFHLLIDQHNGKHRAKLFLQGYKQILKLTSEETKILQTLVRLKLTLSIIEDLRHSNNINHPFIQSCFQLLHTLNDHSTLINNLFE